MVTILLMLIFVLLAALVGLGLYFITPPKGKPSKTEAVGSEQEEETPMNTQTAVREDVAETEAEENGNVPESEEAAAATASEPVQATPSVPEAQTDEASGDDDPEYDTPVPVIEEKRPFGETINLEFIEALRKFNSLTEDMRDIIVKVCRESGIIDESEAKSMLNPDPVENSMAGSVESVEQPKDEGESEEQSEDTPGSVTNGNPTPAGAEEKQPDTGDVKWNETLI